MVRGVALSMAMDRRLWTAVVFQLALDGARKRRGYAPSI